MNKPTIADLMAFKDEYGITLVKEKIFALIPAQWVYTGDQINFNDAYEAHMLGELILLANEG